MASLERQQRSYLPRHKTEEPDCLAAPLRPGHEMNPFSYHDPRAEDLVKAFQFGDQPLRTAIDRHSPERTKATFREISQLAIGRGEGFERAAAYNLSGGAAAGRDPPV